MDFIEPCFGIGHNLSLICQMTSEDIKHQLIISCYICFHHLLLYHNESESGKRKTLCQNWLLSLLLYSVGRSSQAEPEVLCIGNLQRVNIDSYSATESDLHVGQYHCIMQFACAPPFLQETYTHMNHSFKVLLPTL